jgi:signal transduction histidine kinase/ActR/RegA family two-component response regulator
MKLSPAAAAVPLLVLLLTWLSWRAFDPDAERFDRALGALNQLSMAESRLHRDVLRARAGMLRNYDPLVGDVNALDDGLGRLRAAAAVDPKTAAAIDRLAASIAQQETLVEQFKTDNALLQNSLAYFERFSARLGAPDQTGPIAPAVSALAAAMLRLSLDTSPAVAHEVEDRLDALATRPFAPEDAMPLQGLLAHGRMLHDLLPATDAIVKTLCTVAREQNQAAVRAMVLAQQGASRRVSRRFRTLLYLTSLMLVVLLVHLGLQLQARARALRRRAAFEHVIARVSMRFVKAGTTDIDHDIDQALADMATCIGTDRAYFLLSGPTPRTHTWCRDGLVMPAGWPQQAPGLATRFAPAMDGIVHIPNVAQLAPGPEQNACLALGLWGWACAPSVSANGVTVVLGFDAVRHPCRIMPSGELGLLRMARDTLFNAVERYAMEQERTRLEARLQQARRMETVGALASGIAHNFNNIIGAILGYTEMAEVRLPADSQAARNLDEIRRAGERARDLIDNILAFGRRDTRRRSLSVQTMITEAASLLRASLPAEIQLVIRDASGAATVCGEPAQLQQVIVNLCRNAAQAIDGAGTVEIEADLHEVTRMRSSSHGELAPGRYVRIAVSDTGRGMSKPVIERIFEPFFTTRISGNGLGLATVREVVREHGGAMNVWSEPGVGSQFEAWLPCSATVAPVPAEDASPLPLGWGETLLLFNDDRERLLSDEETLAALGYEPVGFADADEALASCRSAVGRYDALVLTSLASTRAALKIAAALHEAAPNLPILLIAGSTEEIAAGVLMAAGVSEVVGRPLVAAETATALKRCLAARDHHVPCAEGVARWSRAEVRR